ncbi:PAS domain-containing sensor histidine kinase [Fodinicurvata sediminis]|uniref:PAS domain-containing sensor histidine kinase n=1 Tax=Fodinicurvata sediminis TaxID=1121832 RepID=UPI0003B5AF15|nr:PAS domain-containing sensor histidine kinase [Fodinicurvata sediminis]
MFQNEVQVCIMPAQNNEETGKTMSGSAGDQGSGEGESRGGNELHRDGADREKTQAPEGSIMGDGGAGRGRDLDGGLEEESYRAIFETAQVGLYRSSRDGRFLMVNQALADILGYDSPEQLCAECRFTTGQLYLDPNWREMMVKTLESRGKMDSTVCQVRRRDGAVRWVRQAARMMPGKDGDADYFVGSFEDVTQQVEAMQRLRVAEASYRSLFEHAREGIYRSSLEGRQLRANPALVRLNGYDSEEELLAAVGNIADEWYVEPGRRAEFERVMAEQGEVVNFVSEVYRHRTRERIWVSENAHLVRAADGAPLYYEGSIREITDERAAEAALLDAQRSAEEANRAKSRFLAGMSHELRTPLNAIIGFSDLILSELYGPLGSARYRDYLQDIRGSGHLLLNLLNDILDLSKVEAGMMELTERAVALPDLLQDCLRMLEARARTAQVELRLELPAELPRLRCDERRLRQIAINLLSNAVKYNRPGGQVLMKVQQRQDGGLDLEVTDSGIGLSEQDAARVFQPFVQIQAEDSDAPSEGVGLGLPLCRELMEMHGGRVVLDSQLGEGTRVTASFPAERSVPPEGA